MPGLKDLLPTPPWAGPPMPRAWGTTKEEDVIEQVRKIMQVIINPALPKSQRLRAYGRLGAIKTEIDRLWDIAKGMEF